MIVADAKTRNPALRASGLAALEVEEAFERCGRAAAIGLAFARIEQDDARSSRSDLIDTRALQSALAWPLSPWLARWSRAFIG